ncbi:MAG: FAD-dependent oxidoreductase [Alphaproteobacteria bacterium]|nr:FAD-dependent oxidoreductase [Alphaproteobacteria bacterium]
MPNAPDLALFAFAPCPELAGEVRRHTVAIVGAGPVGLTAAVDLALHGVSVVVIDGKSNVSEGSRAICWAKRSLEICDRLGTGQQLVDQGVTWNEGEVFHGDELIYSFNLLPEPDHHRPAFINLQQYYFEQRMIERATALPQIEMRWQHQASDVSVFDDHIEVAVETPAGIYTLECDWLLACDGVHSTIRSSLGLDFSGRVFQDRFLISDIHMEADFPAVRRFWFDPTFFDGQSTLLHKQAEGVWRIDMQLGWEADPEEEQKPERVVPRLRRMLGDIEFEIVWTSVYTFTCRRMERFSHGRIFFLGDSAHVVSPFGARGGNGGLQDADNLAWKLALVTKGDAPEALLDSYDSERIPATDENILNSTRSTDFMTPKSRVSRVYRDAVLNLARSHEFARRLVNSGRLSIPAIYSDSPLNTGDTEPFEQGPPPGAPAVDAPVASPQAPDERRWLLDQLGTVFALLAFDDGEMDWPRLQTALAQCQPAVRLLRICPPDAADTEGALIDRWDIAAFRYDGAPGSCYLMRPDQHVVGRWRKCLLPEIEDALNRALARH